MSGSGSFQFPNPGEVGDDFQRFVFQVLSLEDSGLVSFAGIGKDGAIDLASTSNECRNVDECKFIGEEGLQTAQKRWAVTREHLRTNLDKFCEGKLKEKQYLPWTLNSPMIQKYTFCVSSSLGPQSAKDILQKEIKNFFSTISIRQQLAHLHSLEVAVKDATDWTAAIEKDPLLKFRWFPAALEFQGFLPLTRRAKSQGFRQYLSGDRLSYFSREQYAAGPLAWTERKLLNHLEVAGNCGLILHASGGAGKSRLGLELGLQAERMGWMVLRVHESAKSENLRAIEQSLSGRRTIFLFDYVESHRNFLELVTTIQLWNEELGLPVNFIANCRTSYYGDLSTQVAHRSVDLDSRESHSYRTSVVAHILQTRELADASALNICQQVPIRAVFLCYLKDSGRNSDLAGLLNDTSFESWITTKASATLTRLPERNRIRCAAELLTLLPFRQESYLSLSGDPDWKPVLHDMQQDGWFEESSEEGDSEASYTSPHDVFADTLLWKALELARKIENEFLLGILQKATDFRCCPSAFTAIQRIASRLGAGVVDWQRILSDLFQSKPSAIRCNFACG